MPFEDTRQLEHVYIDLYSLPCLGDQRWIHCKGHPVTGPLVGLPSLGLSLLMCLRTVLGVFAASFWTVSWHVCSLVGELRKHGYGSYHASIFARYFDVRTPRNCRLLVLMHSRREHSQFSAGYGTSPVRDDPLAIPTIGPQNSIHHPSKVEQAAVRTV